MQGKDMIGRARTGTGKTLAFGIPIMDRIISYNEKIGLVSLSHLEFFQFTYHYTREIEFIVIIA